MTTYSDGPADQPWEVEKTDFALCYVQRRGFEQRSLEPNYERHYTVDDFEQAHHLCARLNRLDALSAWECADCGARFTSLVPPELLKGVTHCTSCVKVRILTASCNRTRAALKDLVGAVTTLRNIESEWQSSNDDEPSDDLEERANKAAADVARAEQAAREVLNG